MYHLVAADQNATLLGLAAIISAVGGIISTYIGHRQGKKTGLLECQEKLIEKQREVEQLSDELHELRMKHEP